MCQLCCCNASSATGREAEFPGRAVPRVKLARTRTSSPISNRAIVCFMEMACSRSCWVVARCVSLVASAAALFGDRKRLSVRAACVDSTRHDVRTLQRASSAWNDPGAKRASGRSRGSARTGMALETSSEASRTARETNEREFHNEESHTHPHGLKPKTEANE